MIITREHTDNPEGDAPLTIILRVVLQPGAAAEETISLGSTSLILACMDKIAEKCI